jgi:hypothetical protein
MFRRPFLQSSKQSFDASPARAPLALSLEPRMMFDGAVAATVVDTSADVASQDAPPAEAVAADTSRQEVVFIDSRLENHQQLVQAAQASGRETVLVGAGENGLQQIADYLEGRSGVDAIHVIGHGQDGEIRLGSAVLDGSSIAQHENALQRIGSALDSDGDILFYGCEVAASQAGRDLIQQIATLTQADIAASSDDTGAAAMGGNWTLEYRVGAIESAASLDQEALASYDGLLALPSSTQSFSDTYWNNNTGGNTVDGFSLNESTGATRASSPNSIYFDTAVVKDDPGVAGNYYYELTWTADGVDLGKFDLDGMVIQSFGGNYRLDFTATSGGAPVSQSFTYNGAQGPLTVDLNVALFNDISAFTVRVTNLSGSTSVANMDLQQVILADLKGPNTAPTVGNLNGDSVSFIEGGSATLLDSGSNATVADSDSANFDGGNVTASITANRVSGEDVLSIRNEGTGAGQIGVSGANVTYGGTIIGSYSGGTGTNDLVVTLNGNATPAAAQALMRNLTYSNSNTSDPSTSTRTVSITVNDGDGDTSTAANVSVGVTGVNDAPTLSATGGTPTYTENGAAVDLFSGVSVSTVEAGQTITGVTLTVSNLADGASEIFRVDGTDIVLTNGTSGTTTGGNAIGYSVSVVGSTATVTLTKAGGLSAATAQTVVDGMSYRNASEAPSVGNRVVTLTSLTDNGGTANSGADSTVVSIAATVGVTSVNDAPVITAPGSISVTEDVASALTGISFADADAASATVTVTLSVGSGSLAATSGGNVTVAGSGTGSLTLTGSIADINAFIAASGASFTTAANATGNVTLTVDIDDGGNTGTDPGNSGTGSSEADSTTVTLNVTAVNDAPVNAVPSAQAVDQDATLVFSGGNGNQISISDVDAGGGTVRVTLTASNGLLTLSGTTGLSFIAGSGSNDGTMTFEGTIADINLALNGLTFSPTGGYNGAANLQIVTSDLGLSGSGGAQTDTDNIAITVNSLNPQVTDVQVTNPDGGYKVGDIITVTLSFSEAVIVNTGGGSPTLLLETGTTDRLASYVSGSGSNTLTFSYTVQAGDISADLDYQSTGALALNGATIRNAASDDAVLTLPATGGANSIAGQHAIVIDGVAPTVGSVSVPANGTYVAGQNLDFTVNYSETMLVDTGSGTPRLAITLDTGGTVYASYLSGSGSSALVFRYTVQSGQLDGNGISVGGALELNGGTLRDAVGNDASTTLNSVGATGAVLVDAVAPTVASVAVPGSGSYNAGDMLSFTVNTSEAVVVNTGGGTPRLAVDIGGVTRYATYVSGTGTTALVFQYSVQAGDTDADGIAVGGTLDLNGGTTRDAAGNNLNLSLNSVGSTSGVLVDTTAPTPTGLARVDSTPTGADSLRYTLTFNEAVTGVDTSDFTLVGTGTVSGVIQSVVQLDAQTYEVTVGSITGDGTLRLDLNAAGTGITDQAGNSVSVGLNGEVYTLDNTPPAVVAVTVPADAVYVAGQTLEFTVTFDDSVTVDTSGGTPRIAISLDTGGTVYANYVAGSGSSTLTFRYTVAPGQVDLTGITVGNSLDANGGSLRDSLANDATPTLVGTPSTAGVMVDAPAPAPAPVIDAGDPEFRVTPTPPPVVTPPPPPPSISLPPPPALLPPLVPPPLFDVPGLGAGLPPLGNIFLQNQALAPSFLAQVFSSSYGDGAGVGFLGFGGGDGGVFGSSTLSAAFDVLIPQEGAVDIFGEDGEGIDELDEEGFLGAPSLGQQLDTLRNNELQQIDQLANAFGEWADKAPVA